MFKKLYVSLSSSIGSEAVYAFYSPKWYLCTERMFRGLCSSSWPFAGRGNQQIFSLVFLYSCALISVIINKTPELHILSPTSLKGVRRDWKLMNCIKNWKNKIPFSPIKRLDYQEFFDAMVRFIVNWQPYWCCQLFWFIINLVYCVLTW